jgi:hypothetical protein
MVLVAMAEGEAQGYGHWWLGKMMLGFGDVLTMPWGCSKSSSSARNAAQKEIELRASSMLEVEEGA